MADDKWTPYEPIDPAELRAFHVAHGVRADGCNLCGSTMWIIQSGPEAPAAALPSAQDERRANIDLFFPLIVLSCAKCGNVWMIARQVFDAWKADTKRIKEDSNG